MKFFSTVSNIKPIFAFTLLFALTLCSTAHAQNSCVSLLTEKPAAFVISAKGKIKISPELGEMIVSTAEGEIDSITGNRSELKRTVTVTDHKAALGKLGRTFLLNPRDIIQPGTKNVTLTEYLNVLKFDYRGKELAVKIRLRKYGTINVGLPMALENIQIIPSMKDISFLEFKIDHPRYDSSVLKPRGKQLDSDTKLINTPQYVEQFKAISDRAVAYNAKDLKSAEKMSKMQNVLKRLHEEGVPLNLDSRTMYVRTSYVILVRDPVANKEYEIQITVDEEIILYSYPHNKTVDAYKADKPLTVVELKIPVEMVDPVTKGFKAAMLGSMPTLASVQTFLSDLTAAQAPGYESNKGKQSLIRGLLDAQQNP